MIRYGVKKGGETMEYIQLLDVWATSLVKIIIGNPYLLGIILLGILGKAIPKIPKWIKSLRVKT